MGKFINKLAYFLLFEVPAYTLFIAAVLIFIILLVPMLIVFSIIEGFRNFMDSL